MRQQAQALLHKLRTAAMAPSPTGAPRVQLAFAPRELATNGVRPRSAPAAHGARHSAARRAGCSVRAEAQAGGSLPAPHMGPVRHLAGGQTLALQARRAGSALRPQSTLAASSAPAAETASSDADAAPPDVKVVDSLADAEDVVRRLLALVDTGYPVYHAVDTEVCIRLRCGAQPGRSRARHAARLPRYPRLT